MQIILASAKIMNDRVKLIPDISLSMPRFQNEAEGFARDMAQYSAETIAEMLGCSQQIAAQNKLRYMRFFDDAACRTAERRGTEYVRFLEEPSDRQPD